MSTLEDDEALFDDIYGEEKEEPKQLSEKEEEKEELPQRSQEPSQEALQTPQEPPSGSTESPAQNPAQEPSQVPSQGPSQPSQIDPVQFQNFLAHQQQQQQLQQQRVYQQDAVKADVYTRDQGKMFIGGLNWETSEEGLRDYFTKYGDIIDLTIMKDNATGRSRGFGFLTFSDAKSVDAVVRENHILDGKLIDPKRAIPREEQDKTGKIFVGGIAPEVTEEIFTDYFKQFGAIIDAQLMIDKDTGRSRGFGFVTYDSPEAVDRVCANKYVLLKGRHMEIKRAEPRGQQQQQNHLNNRMQQQMMMGGGMNMYGGMNPEMMQQYWQQMQQYWMQMQQIGGQAPDEDAPQIEYQEEESDLVNPQEQPMVPSMPNLPKGPKNSFRGAPRGVPRGPRSGRGGYSRGRGVYGRRGGGYHPYGRS